MLKHRSPGGESRTGALLSTGIGQANARPGGVQPMPYQREAEIVLATWREVERGLSALDLSHDDREHLEAEAARLRDEYQRLVTEAKAHDRPVPPDLPGLFSEATGDAS